MIQMTDKKFIELVKTIVTNYANEQTIVTYYANEHLDKTDGHQITTEDTYIVWYCKTLQNWKALASTTLMDGMYYELTLNGDKNELYLDAYKKFQNRRIDLSVPYGVEVE